MLRSARRWWTQSSPTQLLKSQSRLLESLCDAPFTVTSTSNGINSVEFLPTRTVAATSSSLPNVRNKTVILAHGFGSGLGFFFANVDAILRAPDVKRVILVDWMGMGGSNRPQCGQRPMRGLFDDSTSSWCNSRFTPSESVSFFIDPFDEWLHETVLAGKSGQSKVADERIVLVGHSLGGYLAARYWLRHLDTPISKLVLASPVGFPQKPEGVLRGSKLPTSLRVVDALWSSNVTPQQLVRLMGASRGRRNTLRVLLGRIPQLAEHGQNGMSPGGSGDGDAVQSALHLLADYLYHITVADPSGEFAMNSLLEPVASPETMGVFAREPLEGLLSDEALQSQLASCSHLPDIQVLYGDHDWMRLNEHGARRTLSSLKNSSGLHKLRYDVDIMPKAGHHLYLDNSEEFVRRIVAN